MILAINQHRGDLSEKDKSALRLLSNVENAVNWLGSKQMFERQWAINMAFYGGQQDLSWDRYGQRPINRRMPDHRVRATFNKVLPAVESAVEKMAGVQPSWDARPNTSSAEDVQAARIANRLLDYYHDELQMRGVYTELLMWAAICGTGFLYNTTRKNPRTKTRAYFDPYSGQPIAPSTITESMRAALDRNGFYEDYYAVSPDVAVLSPFRLAFEPAASKALDSRYLLHETPMSVDEAYEKWGIIADPEEPPAGMTDYESRFRSFYGPLRGGSAGGDTNVDGKQTMAREVILKPYVERNAHSSKWDEYPEGRHVLVVGGKVVIDGPNEFYKLGFRGGFPIAPFTWHFMPGRLWGMALVEILIDPQKAYNDIRRRKMDSFRLMGQPKWTAPYGANLKRDAINDRPGEIIEWNASAGPRPEPVTPTPYPPAAGADLEQGAVRDIQDAASQHDIASGLASGDMHSAPAMELALDADRLGDAPKVRRLEEAVAICGENMVRTAAYVLDGESMIEVVGAGRETEIIRFRAAQLKGVRSVRVMRGSMENQSAGMVFQRVLNAAQVGAINPGENPADREIMMRAAQFHEYDPEAGALTMERRLAERENEHLFAPIESGAFGPVQVRSFHNHQIHNETHREKMRSTEFDRLPEWQKAAAETHVAEHEQRIQQVMAAQMAMVEASKGAPGPKGQPSPPKNSSKR